MALSLIVKAAEGGSQLSILTKTLAETEPQELLTV